MPTMTLKHVIVCVAFSCGSLGLKTQSDSPIEKDMSVSPGDEELDRLIDTTVSRAVPIPAYAATLSHLNDTRPPGRIESRFLYWVFAAHHKAGTRLLRNLARYQRDALHLGDCENSGCLTGHCSQHWGRAAPAGTRMWFSCDYNEKQYQAMRDFRYPSHTVHIVRDPLALVVSGYIYHMHSNAHCDSKCQTIRSMNTSDGVAMEAEWALSHTLVDMLRTYELGAYKMDTLTVRFEHFVKASEEFDFAVHKLYEHNGVSYLLTPEQRRNLEETAQQEDLIRNPHHDANHQASADMEDLAVKALQSIPQHLYKQLREVGEKLGYDYH